jgi:hypothetical protein
MFPLLAVATIQALSAGDLASATTNSKPADKAPATPAVASKSKAVKTPITFSITSRMRHGNIVVLLDGVPVFNEEFRKPALLISQTTVWDPLPIAAGKHKLRAKVYGDNNKIYLSALYDFEVSRTKGIEIRFKLDGDKLTLKPMS